MTAQAWWYLVRWLGSRVAAAVVCAWIGLTTVEWFVIGFTVCEVGWFWQIGETARWKRIASDAVKRLHDLQAAENRRMQTAAVARRAPAPGEQEFLDRLSASVREGLRRRSR